MGTRRPPSLWVRIAASLAASWGLSTGAWAGRGLVQPVGGPAVEETAQKVIIAHNGVREVIILQSVAKTDRQTKVVAFMASPGGRNIKPPVQEGCFAAVEEIVQRRGLRYSEQQHLSRAPGEVRGSGPEHSLDARHSGPAGPTLRRSLTREEIARLFERKGFGEPVVTDELIENVNQGLQRGLYPDCFEVLTLAEGEHALTPLGYVFNCHRMYYPLRSVNAAAGVGKIELFTVLPVELHRYCTTDIRKALGAVEGPAEWAIDTSNPVELQPEELARIHPALRELMANRKAILGAIKYEGPLRFVEDMLLQVSYDGTHDTCRAFLDALTAGDVEALETIVAVPFAFDRKEVITDRNALIGRLEDLVKQTKGRRFEVSSMASIYSHEMEGSALLADQFDKDFALQNLGQTGRSYGSATEVTIGQEKMLFFLRLTQDAEIRCEVVGFSD